MKSLRMMLTLFTRFPVGGHQQWDQSKLGKGAVFLPFIGLLIGGGLLLVLQLDRFLSDSLLSLALLLAYLWMTGGLHLDGLADWSDGNFSGRIGDRMLQIMSDSSIGTFGVVAIGIQLLVFYSTAASVGWLSLLLMPVAGRTVVYWLCGIGVSAKKEGLGRPLIEGTKPWQGWLMLMAFLALAYYIDPALLPAGLAATVTGAVIHISTMKKIGGLTGDVLGASIELSQLAWLVVSLAVMEVGL